MAALGLAAGIRRFAKSECDSSPLDRRLSAALAESPKLLGLATQTQDDPIPDLFLAAVHDLLLNGA